MSKWVGNGFTSSANKHELFGTKGYFLLDVLFTLEK